MDIRQQLDETVASHNLNNHPYYEAWRAGELPVSALKTYAEEYGCLVREMPGGWQTLRIQEIVQEELDHKLMWDDFARCLETSVDRQPRIAGTARLVETTSRLFSERLTALGALYAFEVQQPETAASKLKGLQQFYPGLNADLYTEYFEVHSVNHHESEVLLALIEGLSETELETVHKACKEMCLALWDSLTGLMEDCKPMAGA